MKRITLCTLMAAAFAAANMGTASAQVNLVYANGYARSHAQVGVVADQWITRIEKETQGRVKIRHVFGGSLLKPENMIEGLRGRTADIGTAVVSFFPGQLPISATLAGSIDMELGNKLDMKGMTAITMKLVEEFPEFAGEYQKLGLKALFWVPTPPYGVITKAPVTKLDEFRGKKIRTFGNVIPQLVNAVGGVPLSVAFGEIYTSLQTGVLDGALTDPPAMLVGRFDEVAKNAVVTGPNLGALTMIAPVAYIVNLDSWNRIPAQDRKIIEDLNKDIISFGADLMVKEANGAIGTLQSKGVKVTRLSLAEATEWGKKAPDFVKLAGDNITKSGGPGEKMTARYRELAADYLSGKWKP
jgi:TRAP-type C4-dicarboxylate transport system substrate-binding protein